jgi:YbbR domain-containing protein
MKRFIREYLLENWNLKVTALLLALIIWLFVRGEPGPEKVVRIPLEVQVSHNMEITGERPSMIEITMRGAASSGSLFGQVLPTCTIDLQNAGEGVQAVTLTPDSINIPKGSGVEVVRVNPTRITIVLERTASREVPIVVPIRGEPPQGFELYGKSAKPSSIVITGPRTHIEAIKEIATESISVNGQKESTRHFLNLNLKDNAVRTSVSQIQVDISIGPPRKLFTIAQVPVATNDAAYAAVPKQISIQVFAPGSIGTLTSADFNAQVKIEALDASNLPVKAKPLVRLLNNLNSYVTIKDFQPPEVLVYRRK